ncbi:hypothetical protein HJC23_007901 [Cyclotella cryptica]|uniref:Amine oxidase domain-containing protein n=1 Tax=Cyclotella cryptica TaxID=29204 RepID=A0ABD3R0A3_9STRA
MTSIQLRSLCHLSKTRTSIDDHEASRPPVSTPLLKLGIHYPKLPAPNFSNDDSEIDVPYVIVGGGWGGWGAAKALCEGADDVDVTLIDALPDPTGRTPYLSPNNKPVEAGFRGFWKDYPNIYALCDQLSLQENEIFTPYTNSSFYSPDGLEATAPVFAESKYPTLPSPLGQVLATIPYFERLPIQDRASMVGLLLATIDCLGADEATQQQYDRMTAHELFLRFRLSPRLVNDFLKPTLLVGLFKPPEELSALVVMELLYYYALAHQDSFDVRWIKKGTVSETLIAPLAERLMKKENGGLKVLGGCRVKEISLTQTSQSSGKNTLMATKLSYFDTASGTMQQIEDIDGIILALGCQGMQSVVSSSPDLARLPVFSAAASLKGIDVISVRLWFDRIVETRSPANVFSRFDALRGAGGTFFMLDQLQGQSMAELWGEVESDEDGEKIQRGSVVACDFYNAGGLISLSNEDIVKILTDELLPSAVSKFADAKLVDSWVGKYAGVVSWFSPGSYSRRPPLEGAGNDILPNIKCAGDWVRMGEREHGAKGLCQERAYVSGMEAANSLMRSTMDESFKEHRVLPVREDELQFKLGVEVNRKVMQFLPRFWTR